MQSADRKLHIQWQVKNRQEQWRDKKKAVFKMTSKNPLQSSSPSVSSSSKMDETVQELTVVVFGNSSAVHLGDENILLGQGQSEIDDFSLAVSKSRNVSGRSVNVINALDLQDTELYLDSVDPAIARLMNENEINAFVYVIQLCQFTDTNKVGLEWLQRTFSESVLPFVILLFTYEREEDCDTIIDDLKNNCVLEQLVQRCGGRYYTCSKNMNNQSEIKQLLEKIDHMVSENNQCCYTADLYNRASNLREGLQDSKRQQSACNSQLQQDVMDTTTSKQITEKEKVSKPYRFFQTLKSLPHMAFDLIKRRNVSEENVELKVAEDGQRHYEAKDINTGKHTDKLHSEEKEKNMDKETDQSHSKEKERNIEKQTDQLHSEEKERSIEKQTEQLITKLKLTKQKNLKLKTADVLQITKQSLSCQDSCIEKELVQTFLQRLLLVDCRARSITVKEAVSDLDKMERNVDDTLAGFIKKKSVHHDDARSKESIDPMDVQMAIFHCSDNFLKQLMVTKLSQCQYALPLLVPNPFTGKTECPLWTFRQIRKSWKACEVSCEPTSKTKPINEAETPMVFFFRFGYISSSKSQIINSLINEKHNTFFYRDCPGSSKDRLLMDGVVEISWYLPSGKSTDHFTECVAFCNLRGDAETHKKQLEVLTEMSSVNVAVFGDQDENISNNEIIQKLFKDPKPLIFLFCEDDSNASGGNNLKYKIGLKSRNKSEVVKDIKTIIKECFLKSPATFSLEELGQKKEIIKDENDEECQKGKEAAMRIMELLKGIELSEMKEKYLPCQGKLWHEWCQKKKELHRLQGPNIEKQKCKKQTEMKQIRSQQHSHGRSELMELFIYTLESLTENQKCYFLKWLGILLDNSTTDKLSAIRHKYDVTWSKLLDLKGQADKSEHIEDAQMQLKEISKTLTAASFGLEHILREMGQIYESFLTVQVGKNDFTLPKLAAEVVLSGHPLELMDGDSGHVPLVWVSAVLDELVRKLGDQKVFVLSVLGLQSSGKSTMLNAMFGLQFAVSAGRCTRGAFMQLVKVSEEMKEELKFDYICVVDTEGLRALEFTGMSTRQQDNGLATFVVGLGNMTLINIFGENPAEMQDILQIVVQAFLRMKKVRLNPSCMFVHQNVGDVTAGEKNIEGRKRLLDKLDEMTKLAAKDEDCSAKCFSDVIAFDVRDDVCYFAQLWEGSPPMAPPNPPYCENIQNLKRSIISKISKSRGVTLSEFKANLSSLWNALLDENFVFSFRNTLEIALYRKLEHEYSKWTWSLRSAMLTTENKLHNRVTNEHSMKIDKKNIMECLKETKADVETSVKKFFEEDRDKDILIQWKDKFERKIAELCNELVEGTKRKLDEVIQLKIAREKVDREKKAYESKLFKLSKDLAFSLKNKDTEEGALEEEFEDVWSKWVTKLTWDAPSFGEINIWSDVTEILSENYELNLVCERQNGGTYKRMDVLGSYLAYVILKNQEDPGQEDLQSTNEDVEEDDDKNVCAFEQEGKEENLDLSEESFRTSTFTADDHSLSDLIKSTATEIEAKNQRVPIVERGYSRIYIPEMIDIVKRKVKAYEDKTFQFKLRKEFTVDLCLYVCNFAAEQFAELHKEFKEAYDVRLYLERQRPQYLNIFKNYYSGATSTAVFGQLIVDSLEPSILQAAYDQTAIDLSEKMKRDVPAFNGNRSNLEKHILTLLAEEENFKNYIEYMKNPREHFNNFIKKKVKSYMFEEKCLVVLECIKNNINSKGKCVMDAVKEATRETNGSNGDVNKWLQHLSQQLKDELQFKETSYPEKKEITDLDFLQEVVIKGLTATMPKLSDSFQDISHLRWEMFKKKPDKILVEDLCRCCWAKCPFCNAICTNTMEDHTGDHSVRFHRNCGTNGWSYKFKNQLGIDFCTTAVISNLLHFNTPDGVFSFRDYRTAGGEYARWNISPDNSEMPYWKWFVCTFQEDLEKHYNKKFLGHGAIPNEWRDCTKEKAIESLKEL